MARGQRVSRPVKIRYLLNSERIQTATTQLRLGIINTKEFLLQCSHCAGRYLQDELNWYINIEHRIEDVNNLADENNVVEENAEQIEVINNDKYKYFTKIDTLLYYVTNFTNAWFINQPWLSTGRK